MNISDFDYPLPDERIAKFPLCERDASKLLVWRDGGHGGNISETRFGNIAGELPPGSLFVFNNTRVVRARLVLHRASGGRIELLCLEPVFPADYERAFATRGSCKWRCMVGGLKKWLNIPGEVITCSCGDVELRARLKDPGKGGADRVVHFEWDGERTFSEMLELAGRVPIPPYLGRDSEEIDNTRYQTVYSRFEGSVAAPTAGLHFTPELIERLGTNGVEFDEVTLHVGAGTFLPVKVENALEHPMHTEHFEITLATVEHLLEKHGHIIAVGTTSARTLESLAALAWRIETTGDPELKSSVSQFEPYHVPMTFNGKAVLYTLSGWMRRRGVEKIAASTQIMITPAGFRFRVVSGIVTNFHQPKSTLLLLVSAFTGGTGGKNDEWRRIYDYALAHDFRFLSYGDSSLLLKR